MEASAEPWERDGSMSDMAYTPTRMMAQSAGQKAADAYAVARQADGRVEAAIAKADEARAIALELAARVAALERMIGLMQTALDDLARPAPATRRKAA